MQGGAFLCIWNRHDPAQHAEYQAWHTFEHVPERVCVPGFLAGRRYADQDRYITLYDLASLDVLETPAYRDLVDNPTPWSRRMRAGFRDFLRIPCRTIASDGVGCGGALGVVVAKVASAADLRVCLEDLLARHLITAFRVGLASAVPAYDVFGAAAQQEQGSAIQVILIEALSQPAALSAAQAVAALLSEICPAATVLECESADLLFQIRADQLAESPLRRC